MKKIYLTLAENGESESAPSLEQTPTLKIQKFNEHPGYLFK